MRLAGGVLLVVVGLFCAPALAAPRTAKAAVRAAALGAESKVPVQADVVFASTAKGEVDPSLVKMQETLGAKVKYLTLKKLSSKTLTLEAKAKPQALALPNKKSAELSVESLTADVATVRVKLPPTEATYTLGREKSLYLQAGAHDGGDLWLVLSQPK